MTNFDKHDTILITGANGDLGHTLAKQFLQKNYRVILNFHNNSENILTLSKQYPNHTLPMKADITNYEEMERMIEEIMHTWGKIDILINNAGIKKDALFDTMTPSDWDSVLRTNVIGTINTTHVVYKHMKKKKSGTIINITSVVAHTGNIGQTNYAASKLAITGFTKSLALEAARHNIDVNCVAPGYIDSTMIRSVPKKILDKIKQTIPYRRLAIPQEIAEMIVFLCEKKGRYITGQTLHVNGGKFL